MEKITSSLPLLYHYTPYQIITPPPYTHPNNPFTVHIHIYPQTDPFCCTSTISFSAIVFFSLFTAVRVYRLAHSSLARVSTSFFLRGSVTLIPNSHPFNQSHIFGAALFAFLLVALLDFHVVTSLSYLIIGKKATAPTTMDDFGSSRFKGIGNTIRKKRTQTSRRPKPEAQALPESHDQASLSSTPPSDDASKISSDENAVDANPRRKVFNLNQCASMGSSGIRTEGEHSYTKVQTDDGGYDNVSSGNGGSGDVNEEAQSGLNHKHYDNSGATRDGGLNEGKSRKVKLKVGGLTRTIHPKSSVASGSGSSPKNGQSSDAPRPRPKLILQENSDEDPSPRDKKIGLQGVPWKDFSRGGFRLGREDSSIRKTIEGNSVGKQGEKSERVRKSKRVPKKHVLDGDSDDDDDDEIRYLEKLKTVKVTAAYKDFDEDSTKKHGSLSRVSKGSNHDKLEHLSPLRASRDARSKSDSVSIDTDYEDEDHVSDRETEGKKRKRPIKDSPDSPTESRRETTLTSRQRALLSGRGSGASQTEFPNGLPPAPSRKQKEKLTEVEQQLRKAEVAERRRMQNEKAARESEAEAIRKILGQDSSRKKREDKLKKRQEELAQERAVNAKTLAPNTVRTVFGPNGTVVSFAEDIGLPHIFDAKPCCYPGPRAKCAGPSCSNPYRYRDSQSKLPVCSLQCYKAVRERMQAETAY